MGFVGQVWRLERSGEPLGEILVDEAEFPWLRGRFRPGPAFAEVAPWFARSLAVLDAGEYGRFDEEYAPIAATLTLRSPTGPAAEFLLHIEDDRAWFRWSTHPPTPRA
ncbi:hypothetical protein ACN20G_32885 (plasmid) [Streptomyces sp. BI20]|uniref:hypothetical protein n=1 Tax=Streptomyces sp. BI20 TaxID=3403460 RepID=UPI003C73DBCE